MEYRTLGGTGLRVSKIGFGAATVGNEYGLVDPAEIQRAVHYAIDQGINIFDVAPYYGRTLAETRLGECLKGRRHEVILATKCARYGKEDFDFSAARIMRSVDESLKRLQTDYLDIFHVHDIEFGHREQIIQESLPAMRKIQESGKARFIGITGLEVVMLREVAEAFPVDCMLSYCRYTLLNTDLDEVLAPFCRATGIGLMNASPLHMGLLTNTPGPPWHPAHRKIKEAAQKVAEFCRSRGLEVSEVALGFAANHPDVACTFSGISTVEEAKQNIRAVERAPDPELLAQIEQITAPVKRMIWPSGLKENWDPMTVPYGEEDLVQQAYPAQR